MTVSTEVATAPKLTLSQRFANKVATEFGAGVGELALTDFQKRLVQNYFMLVDAALKTAEENRMKKKEANRDDVPVTWDNVNLEQLARNVVAAARIGLDPAQKNHINAVPYKNNRTKQYDIGFIEGYRGMELKATKYGLDVPDAVVVELVYENDEFTPIKKDRNNSIENYVFKVANPFDRGKLIGGFYYLVWRDVPEKNRLAIFSMKDILKRKPTYASVEFWGGEKDIWENKQKTGKKEMVEGWFDEMCYKTICRAAYGSITIDSQKIDDDYLRLKDVEQSMQEAEIERNIEANANMEAIDIQAAEVVHDEYPTESIDIPTPAPAATKQETPEQTGFSGPGF